MCVFSPGDYLWSYGSSFKYRQKCSFERTLQNHRLPFFFVSLSQAAWIESKERSRVTSSHLGPWRCSPLIQLCLGNDAATGHRIVCCMLGMGVPKKNSERKITWSVHKQPLLIRHGSPKCWWSLMQDHAGLYTNNMNVASQRSIPSKPTGYRRKVNDLLKTPRPETNQLHR